MIGVSRSPGIAQAVAAGLALSLAACEHKGPVHMPVGIPPGMHTAATAAEPRVAPDLAPLVAWLPNDTTTLMLLGARGTTAEIDRLVEPLLMELPDAISSMLSGVRAVRQGFEIVGGAFTGPIFVRAEGGGFAKKDAIGRLRAADTAPPIDVKAALSIDTVNGYRVKENTRAGIESWSTVTIADDLVALVPRESIDWFTRMLAVHAVGDPLALRGVTLRSDPNLVAMIWYVPAPSDRDMRPLDLATARLTHVGEDLRLELLFAPQKPEDTKALATALEDIKRAAPARIAASYKAAKVTTTTALGHDRVTFDVTFTKAP